jgi:hypothetical protein
MTCPLIAEHRLIGDLQTAALVTTDDLCGHVDDATVTSSSVASVRNPFQR